MSEEQETLEDRIQKAIWRESFYRVESALIIGLTMIGATIAGLLGEPWMIAPVLLGGALLEAGLVYSSATDPKFGEQVANKLLIKRFEPKKRFRTRKLQRIMNEAMDYRSRIESAIRNRENTTMLRDELVQTAAQIDEWLEHMYGLAERIERYSSEEQILARDSQRAEKRIRQLERQKQEATDPAVKQQIEITLNSLHRQLNTLGSLENTLQRAELQLENSLTHLGTIYSQAMLFGVKDIDSGRARRLRQEINEEVIELGDILSAMDEVYAVDSL